MAAYRDNFAIQHTLPDDESELGRDAERDGRVVGRCEVRVRRGAHLFRENPGVRLVTKAAFTSVKSFRAAT
jgi:hypothetical protein